jgi:hypothetical protein
LLRAPWPAILLPITPPELRSQACTAMPRLYFEMGRGLTYFFAKAGFKPQSS